MKDSVGELPQQPLRERQDFQFLADALPQIVWAAGADGLADYCNRAWHEYTGLSLEETRGDGWRRVLHPDDLDECMRRWWRSFESGNPFEMEYRFRRASDGEYRWHLGRCLGMKDKSGRVVRWFGTATDIHDQKLTEEALRRGESDLADFFENVALGLHWVGPDGRVLRVNRAELELLGYSREEYLGRHIGDFHADPETIKDMLARLSAGETLSDYPARLRCKDGSIRHVLINSNVHWDGGRFIHTRCFTRDVTDRERAEQALREVNDTLERRVTERTAEAEERASQLRALASEVTMVEQRERRRIATLLHDELAQSLAMSKMGLSLVRNARSEERRLKALGESEESISKAIAHVRSLMYDLSPPMLHDLGLAAALEGLGERMEQQHGLKVHVEEQGTVASIGDDLRVLLYQAVREVLTNAIKHGRARKANVVLARPSPGELTISVSDDGDGFDTGACTFKPHSGGGFGLFNIRERLGLVGGRMTVESEPGGGTTVHLHVIAPQPPAILPAGKSKGSLDAEQVNGPRGAALPGAIRVLLMDDHRMVRDGLAGLLREHPDIEVVGEAEDGLMAVELAERLRPAVAVIDVTMPRLNGIDATRRMTAEVPGVRVVGLSMHADEETALKMRQAGAAAYLTKDDPIELLIGTIRRVATEAAPDPIS